MWRKTIHAAIFVPLGKGVPRSAVAWAPFALTSDTQQ